MNGTLHFRATNTNGNVMVCYKIPVRIKKKTPRNDLEETPEFIF